MNNITNPHFLYLHSSIATQKQVYDYIQQCIGLFEDFLGEKLNREIIVNTVTKYDGTPLKHSYVWCRSVEVVNLLLNRTKDGMERTENAPDPEHDTTEAENDLIEFFMTPTPLDCLWSDLVEEEERLVSKTVKRNVKRQMKPFVDFGTIEMTEEQKKKYLDSSETKSTPSTEIQVKMFHLSIPIRAGYSHHRLFALHVSKDVSEQQLRKYFEPYSSLKKNIYDKKNYPVIYIDRRSNPTCVTISYQPATYDAIFALLMNKKIMISEKCMLNFELFRE
jgi:hypothetical protein